MAYAAANPEKVRARRKVYHQTPGFKAKNRESQRRRRLRQEVAVSHRMSSGMAHSLKGGGSVSWQRLVGYTLDDLRRHLERQFLPGMSWANIGEWHIDHIVPLKIFTFSTPTDPEFKAAWAITNLRPLWAIKNMQKSAKREFLL